MANLTIAQFETITQALNNCDTDLAVKVIRQDTGVDQYELKIDSKVLTTLALHHPVANDLRTVVAISKIVTDLERIGDELVKIARLTIDLYSADNSRPHGKLLREIAVLTEMNKAMLLKTAHCFDTGTIEEAYELINSEEICNRELQNCLTRQFNIVLEDARLIGTTLDILQIINCLERCSEHCLSIAEHRVFMIEGKDIRHQKSS